MMKTWLAVGVAVVLGIGGGIGTALVRVQLSPWDGTPAGSLSAVAPPLAADTAHRRPRVFVEEDTHDFGVMESNAKGRHEFILTNVGDDDLTLKEGHTSCKCTMTILEEGKIAPGESGKVVVEWTGKDTADEFTQTATILTNDPTRRQVTLTIKGRITVAARAVPSELRFTAMTAGDEGSAQVKLFGFRSDPLKIIGYDLSDPTSAENFLVTFQPLSADQLTEQQDATSGHLVEVTVKPGLPLGAFRQKIIFNTNSDEVPTIEVPVRGTISSEILIVGKGWNQKEGVLTLGVVRSREGVQRDLFVRASGPHRKEVSFKPIKIYPDLLKVKLGETRDVENGKIALTPLTIQVPKGSPPADYLGIAEGKTGEIIFETGHPTAHEFRILVRFVIQG